MSPALDFPRHNCHRRADYLSSWLSVGSPGQGQSPCTAAFRGAWGQGITAGETLLHKEFMRARKLSQGMDKSRDLRKISTGGWGKNRHHGAELPQSFFHWTVLHQIHVFSYRFHVTLSFLIPVSRLENWNEGFWKRVITKSGHAHYLYQAQ